MYDKVFGKIVTCGPKPQNGWRGALPDIFVDVNRGYQGYHCMGRTMEKYPGYEGKLQCLRVLRNIKTKFLNTIFSKYIIFKLKSCNLRGTDFLELSSICFENSIFSYISMKLVVIGVNY